MNSETTSGSGFTRKLVTVAVVLAVVLSAGGSRAAGGNEVVVLVEGYDRFPRVGATITLVKAKYANIVCDPGLVKDRQLIVDALKSQGLEVEDITHVFLTHQHTDHTANAGMFPNARIVDAHGVYYGDHWGTLSSGSKRLAPGVEAVATPGHTNEDYTLFVETADGVYAITHAWWQSDMTPEVDPYAEAPNKLTESREDILGRADWIIPGHGGAFKNPGKN